MVRGRDEAEWTDLEQKTKKAEDMNTRLKEKIKEYQAEIQELQVAALTRSSQDPPDSKQNEELEAEVVRLKADVADKANLLKEAANANKKVLSTLKKKNEALQQSNKELQARVEELTS